MDRTFKSKEEIEALLEGEELKKKCMLVRIQMIEFILQHGENVSDDATIRWLAGKENFDRWLKEPDAAREAIEESREMAAKHEQRISELKASQKDQ